MEALQRQGAAADRLPLMSSNIRHLCRLEIPGGGQVTIDGKYAYVGYQKNPQGTSILDISDPRKPKILSTLQAPDPMSHTHKVRVLGDLMFVNAEHQDRKRTRLNSSH